MAARPLNVVFDELVKNKGRGAVMRRKFAANKDRTWFLALVLHSFAKHAEGTKLTDLEQTIVSAFRDNGYTDEEIKAHGKLDRQLPQTVRTEMFPSRFAQLDVKQNYTMADLKRDAAGITASVRAVPSVTMADADGRTVRTAASAATPATAPAASTAKATKASAADAPDDMAAAASSSRFTIKAAKFTCVRRMRDSIADPKNEPYFVFGSLGAGTAVTTRSTVFDDVDDGSTRTFGAADGCLWGQNCSPQALPAGEVASLIALFEHDSGDVERIRAGVASAFLAAAGILGASVVAAWVAAVVAGVGVMIQWLIGFMEDDHIADNVLVFTSALVVKQLPSAGRSYDVARRFTDGQADYSLTVKVARTA